LVRPSVPPSPPLTQFHILIERTGLTKAEYAVGYFTEMGIGCRRDPLEANVWYVKAAEAGDERAKHRLAAIRAAASGGMPMEVVAPRNGSANGSASKMKKSTSASDKTAAAGQDGKDCALM
jgi:TPR repeat protein